jgi:hypothetical protein
MRKGLGDRLPFSGEYPLQFSPICYSDYIPPWNIDLAGLLHRRCCRLGGLLRDLCDQATHPREMVLPAGRAPARQAAQLRLAATRLGRGGVKDRGAPAAAVERV